ncbi:enhanced intracellular survival protein Eis [Actinoplanes sp. NPDC049265]|uniref:GNAT family N-acetyltransferase n=1 Tax=Actinoplanes sp. NPDC049265 TaxID=3363902 RepID=UPI00370FA90C
MRIRQVGASERADVVFPLTAYAFEPTREFGELREKYRRRMRYFEHVTTLVGEEEGVGARACVAAFPMRENVRGRVVDMAGVASVASHPESRRRGYVRELLWRLLEQMRDQGAVVSTLYPFRPSFYARFGFVGMPRRRRVGFAPEGLPRVELPGTVELRTNAEGFADYLTVLERVCERTHGFALFDELRTAEFGEAEVWLAVARGDDGEVLGALPYEITNFGDELDGRHLLATGPLGRALLLQFLARHVDQVRRCSVWVGPDAVPELWGTDLEVTLEGLVDFPTHGGPMARVLDMRGLDGMGAGDGDVTVEVVDDPFVAGVHRLVGEGGRLSVTTGGAPRARLSVAGLSALVYGVLDPVEVMTRGLGQIEYTAVDALRALFPRELPYLFADF